MRNGEGGQNVKDWGSGTPNDDRASPSSSSSHWVCRVPGGQDVGFAQGNRGRAWTACVPWECVGETSAAGRPRFVAVNDGEIVDASAATWYAHNVRLETGYLGSCLIRGAGCTTSERRQHYHPGRTRGSTHVTMNLHAPLQHRHTKRSKHQPQPTAVP